MNFRSRLVINFILTPTRWINALKYYLFFKRYGFYATVYPLIAESWKHVCESNCTFVCLYVFLRNSKCVKYRRKIQKLSAHWMCNISFSFPYYRSWMLSWKFSKALSGLRHLRSPSSVLQWNMDDSLRVFMGLWGSQGCVQPAGTSRWLLWVLLFL